MQHPMKSGYIWVKRKSQTFEEHLTCVCVCVCGHACMRNKGDGDLNITWVSVGLRLFRRMGSFPCCVLCRSKLPWQWHHERRWLLIHLIWKTLPFIRSVDTVSCLRRSNLIIIDASLILKMYNLYPRGFSIVMVVILCTTNFFWYWSMHMTTLVTCVLQY